jgi:hypothetical protein
MHYLVEMFDAPDAHSYDKIFLAMLVSSMLTTEFSHHLSQQISAHFH